MDIEKRIMACMESMGFDISGFENTQELNITEQENFSSLTFITLIVALEDEFNIEFPSELLRIDIVSSLDVLVKTILRVLAEADS